jgi:Zn-dependent peptidase ImmA (M78 family)/plasmid maintenance system antidote protein VapI
MAQSSAFEPQWTSPPGSTIVDLLALRQLTRVDLASRLDASPAFIDALLDGREAITLGLARRLQEVVGGSAAFWMTRDSQYRADVARLREAGTSWLFELPLQDMERFGWIPSDVPDGFEVESLLRYFAVPSVPVWRARYAAVLQDAAFRTSPSFESKLAAVAAWLRQGERVAQSITCDPWDADALRRTLLELRSLTRVRDPQRFIPKLQEAAARCGIAVVVLQAPSGCRASGVARWLSDDKALILMSARHLTDDHFWFTFFHECGHLLLHRDTRIFIDEHDEREDRAETAAEDEANRFAVETLIPPSTDDALARVRLETFAVVRLAGQLGVAPGIVVAQLQRSGRLPKNHLNRLKRRFTWENGTLVSRETA